MLFLNKLTECYVCKRKNAGYGIRRLGSDCYVKYFWCNHYIESAMKVDGTVLPDNASLWTPRMTDYYLWLKEQGKSWKEITDILNKQFNMNFDWYVRRERPGKGKDYDGAVLRKWERLNAEMKVSEKEKLEIDNFGEEYCSAAYLDKLEGEL